MLELSLAEQRLLSFAHKEYGEFLAQFLVAGLGEMETVPNKVFTITCFSDVDNIELRRIQLMADDLPNVLPSLPSQREPIVLLALLYLKARNKSVNSNTLSYTTQEVLKSLGWQNTPESQLAVDEAVERYFNLTYRILMDDDGLKRQQLAFFSHRGRIISQFSTTDSIDEHDQARRLANKVNFSSCFIDGLQQRAFLELDWNKVRSLTVDTN